MAIKRTRLAFEANFTRIPNEWLRDKRLSRRARGLLAELMTHQVGWDITVESLMEGGTEGRDALLKALAELEAYGYLTRQRTREGGKFKGTDYVITDPHAEGAAESPRPENPDVVESSPRPENPEPPRPEKPRPENPEQRRTSSKEDHLLEDHSVNADAFTGGEAVAEALPIEVPAVAVAQADSPKSPEEWVAKCAYDGTSGALNFMAIKGIAKWAIHTKGCHPRAVLSAVQELYTGGRAVTKQTVAQRLDGIITPAGRTNQPNAKDEKIRATLGITTPAPAAPAGALTADPFQLRITP